MNNDETVLFIPTVWPEVVCDLCNALHTVDDTAFGGALLRNSWACCPECVKANDDAPKHATRKAAGGQTFFDFITLIRIEQEMHTHA